jgi:hypothetical protein
LPSGLKAISPNLSLSKAKKEEVVKFIEQCITFATEILDVEIPEPSKL